MSALAIATLQWANLNDIDDVEPIGAADVSCISEVYEVLRRHGLEERFGLALLHKHFDLNDDEVLVETTDKIGRRLTIEPVVRSEAGKLIETIWSITKDDNAKIVLGCRQYCAPNIHGNHGSFHSQT